MNDMAALREGDILRRAEAMVPLLRERGAEGEERRQLPEATLADLATARIPQALRPAAAGGLQLGLQAFVDITRMISRGDASTGWIAGFYMGHACLLSKLGMEAQDEIFAGRPTALAAGTISQPGRATRVDGGYRLDGKWRFASGVLHAQWIMLLAFAEEGALMCTVPVSTITILDTWHIAGMKATGSNDVEAHDLFVPDHLATPFFDIAGADCPGAREYDYPLLRYPPQWVLSLVHPAVALGVADAALELFKGAVEGRVRVPGGTRVIEESTLHEVFAQALDERRCAELRLRDAVDIADECFGSGGSSFTEKQGAEVILAITSSGDRAFRAVDQLLKTAGASIHRTGHPLDRICRDTQVMRNHTVLDFHYHMPACGQVLLMGPDAGAPLKPLKGA